MNTDLTRAWDDVQAKYGSQLFSTMESKFWIDSGVRIERFNNGHIELKVCLEHGDNFTDLTQAQAYVFEDHGWESGVMRVNMDFFESLLRIAENKVLSSKIDEEREKAMRRVVKYEKTRKEFSTKYEESLDIQ
jgi:hypothetical protein